jgi:hypothetical protein
MGSPPTGFAPVVERRRENRVTGAQARTDRRSLETIGPNFKGSRQSQPGEVTQRSKHAGKKNDSRGLDNRGNIEGNTKPLFRPTAATARLHRRPLRARSAGGSPSTPQQRVARRSAAMRGLDRRRRRGYGRASGISRASERPVGKAGGAGSAFKFSRFCSISSQGHEILI